MKEPDGYNQKEDDRKTESGDRRKHFLLTFVIVVGVILIAIVVLQTYLLRPTRVRIPTYSSNDRLAVYQPFNEGLVAYFPFNGNANDESGNNHNGITFGATLSKDGNGNKKNAYFFDGDDDFMDISSVSNSIPLNHTRCAWIKTNMDSIGQILCTGNFANNRGCYLAVKENKLVVGGSANRWNNVLIDDKITDNQWHFVCAAYENGNSAKVYIDGEFRSQVSIGYDTGDWITYIGKNHKRDIQYFNGVMDQVRIYDRILSDNEIKTLFQTGI